MGLDMYLSKKTYVARWDHQKPEDKFRVSVKRGNKKYTPINSDKVTYVIEQVAYWRKANQIHNWFVKNVQNGVDECQESYVDSDDLLKLVSACNTVLEDHSRAEELLPSSEGFFFGHTEYDEWYFKDLEDTIDMLAPFLTEGGDDGWGADFVYQASW